jgi:hypothetical protein
MANARKKTKVALIEKEMYPRGLRMSRTNEENDRIGSPRQIDSANEHRHNSTLAYARRGCRVRCGVQDFPFSVFTARILWHLEIRP